MDKINFKFSDKFRTHWIKVKFYKNKPVLSDVKRLKNIRFCEATEKAISFPVLLDRESVSCPGARYAFGWDDKGRLLDYCREKGHIREEILNPMLEHTPFLTEPFDYIGLNTSGDPDLIISFVLPESAKDLVKQFQYNTGENLDVSLCSMMPICSGIAVKTFLEEKITFSFGCDDSRKYAKIGRNRLVVGIPKILFNVFVA